MRKFSLLALVLICGSTLAADTSLTIYNQDFAVVRGMVPLDLHEGVNDVRFNDTTAFLEPSSVILRDPAGKVQFQVLEQNYRADPVTKTLMLSLFEGQTIDFRMEEDHKEKIVRGKVVRSGYDRSRGRSSSEELQPIIEVDGKLRFELPGEPLFPSLANDTILKPELTWRIAASVAAKLEAEIAYITRKMSWTADYNAVAPEQGDNLQLVGWVTIENKSGKKFENAQTKLVAGHVNKIEPTAAYESAQATTERVIVTGSYIPMEKSFEDFHLYALPRPVTLLDQETKQIEFIRAENIPATRRYIYGSSGFVSADTEVPVPSAPQLEAGPDTDWEKRVAIVREFKNSEENQLGMPLPKGRWRFYRSDSDGQLEFTGENEIDHTPKDEMLRIFTGYAFDIVGEKRRIDFASDPQKRTADESFEIKLRNHKKEPAEVRVIEFLWRWTNWEITQKSDPFVKKSAQRIEFTVTVPPDGEKTLTYKVHYTRLAPPKNAAASDR